MWRQLLDYNHDVFIKSCRVPNPCRAGVGFVVRSAFMFSSFPYGVFLFEFLVPKFPLPSFSFSIMSTSASDGGAGAGALKSASSSRDTWADPRFPASHFISKYCAYLDWPRFVTMQMNVDSGSVWHFRFQRSGNIVVGPLKRGGGTGVVVVPLIVVAFHLLPTIHSFGDSWRSSTKWSFC